jgi:hypothetical protein
MGAAASRLSATGGPREDRAARATPARKEPRESLVRIVEYAPFPRMRGDQRERRGSTMNVSASGMCLAAEILEPVGSLLRLVVRSVTGRPEVEALGRVVWAAVDPAGGPRFGIALVPDSRRVLRVPAFREGRAS